MKALQINAHLRIPLAEIHFDFTTSQGPGGQNVNKVATRALLSFDVLRSPSLSEFQRNRIAHDLRSRINKDGLLRISCGTSRSQESNRREALSILTDLIRQALRPRRIRRPTKPTSGSVQRRHQEKKVRSERKRHRRSTGWDE